MSEDATGEKERKLMQFPCCRRDDTAQATAGIHAVDSNLHPDLIRSSALSASRPKPVETNPASTTSSSLHLTSTSPAAIHLFPRRHRRSAAARDGRSTRHA